MQLQSDPDESCEALGQGSVGGGKKAAKSGIYWWQVSAGRAPAPSLKVSFKVLPNLLFPGSHSRLREGICLSPPLLCVPVVLQS